MDAVHAGETAVGAAAFGAAVMPALRRLVPCDSVAYNVVDFKRNRVEYVTDPPELASEGNNGALNQFLHQHPVARYHEETGDGSAVQIADFLSTGRFHALDLYHAFYKPLAIEQQLIVSLILDRDGEVALSLNRQGRQFYERDRAVLNLLCPHLRGAYQAANAREIATQIESGRQLAGDRHAVVLMDGTGRPERMIGHAARWLASYHGGDRTDSLPDRVAGWLRNERARWSSTGQLPEFPQTLTCAGERGRLVIHYLRRRAAEESDMLLLVHTPHARFARTDLAGLGLSPRQADVLDCVSAGMSDAQIADALFVSPRTVQKHLEHIYARLGVHNRTAALSVAIRAVHDSVD